MSIHARSLFATALSLLIASSVYAQAGPPKYDLTAEAKFKVTVQDLKLPAKGKEKEVMEIK